MKTKLKNILKKAFCLVMGIEPEDFIDKTPIEKMSKKEVLNELYEAVKKYGSFKEAQRINPDLVNKIINRLDDIYEQDMTFI